MSDRIRQLEDALRERCSPHEAHPLLDGDGLNVKSTMELYSSSAKPDSKPDGKPEDHKGEIRRSHSMDVDHVEKTPSTSSLQVYFVALLTLKAVMLM
jgi:hypothetical protein